jgi:hypothetical protein
LPVLFPSLYRVKKKHFITSEERSYDLWTFWYVIHICNNLIFILGYIMFWVSSILTYSKGESKTFPQILLCCTHKDKVPEVSITITWSLTKICAYQNWITDTVFRHMLASDGIFFRARCWSFPKKFWKKRWDGFCKNIWLNNPVLRRRWLFVKCFLNRNWKHRWEI